MTVRSETRLKTVGIPAVIGLDTGSNRIHGIGPRVGTRKRVEEFAVKSKDPNPDVRRHELYEGTRNYLRKASEAAPTKLHIFCEEPLALQNGKTTRLLGLVAGAIWASHLDFDCYWYWVNVSTWKRDVVGSGNAKKEQVQEWVQQQGYNFTEEDYFDAFCIREYGVQVVTKLIAGGQA